MNLEFLTWNEETAEIVKMIGLAILVIVALFILFKLEKYIFKKVINRKITEYGKRLKGIRLRSVELLTPAQLVSAAFLISKILRISVYVFLLYVALPILFAIFPATRHLTGILFSLVIDPVIAMGRSFVAYLPKLLRIVIIILVMRYILKLLRLITAEIEAGRLVIPKFYPDWARATYTLLRIFIYAFTLVLIYPLLPESESSVFRGVSVFVGVLFSIGSSSVISNMMAGLVITYMRSFKIGDRIKVGDSLGDVFEKTLFVVRLQTVRKEIITIPNSTILSSNIVNYSVAANEQGVVLFQAVDISYDITWERVNKLLIEAAIKTEHVQPDPPPFVLVRELGSSATTYQINIYTKRPDLQARIYSELNRHILDIFQRDGIDMVTPIYEAAREWEGSTIPAEYRKTE
ncbi:MAG: mechanosensitive ion channel family protein [Chitinispirillales bacterium]|jgi:small-conductance mechanosensitive channel|nr:mechanosensitive ion channel family protein [Chitinispirillales bacterium]